MPLTVTPTVNTTTRTVSVVVSGGTPPYALFADPVGSPSYAVRGAWTGTGATLTKVDAEARLNTDIQYSATDAAAGAATSAIVRVDSDTSVLSDALDYTAELDALVVSQPPNEYEARTRTWDVIGRTDPFVSAAPMRLRSGEVVLRCETAAEWAPLRDLLAGGSPLLLRSAFPAAVDDVVMAVERVREELVLDDLPAGPRNFRITYQAVSRDLGTYTGADSRTYTQVKADAATYTDLLVKFSRYDDVRTGAFR